jgi:hypothetical protein
MNSDFVQLEAEALAKRVAAEPDNRARIRKLYTLTYGRLPSDEEIQIGLGYLHSEPLKEYEEDKNKPKENPKDKPAKDAAEPAATPGAPLAKTEPAAAATLPEAPKGSTDADPEAPAEGDAAPDAAADANLGMGMMAGMGGRKGQAPPKPEIKYEPSVWGRYAKVLLSSTEFTFIN